MSITHITTHRYKSDQSCQFGFSICRQKKTTPKTARTHSVKCVRAQLANRFLFSLRSTVKNGSMMFFLQARSFRLLASTLYRAVDTTSTHGQRFSLSPMVIHGLSTWIHSFRSFAPSFFSTLRGVPVLFFPSFSVFCCSSSRAVHPETISIVTALFGFSLSLSFFLLFSCSYFTINRSFSITFIVSLRNKRTGPSSFWSSTILR